MRARQLTSPFRHTVVQGVEYAVLPQLISHGVLCSTVDVMTIEFHSRFAPMPKLSSWQKLIINSESDAQSFESRIVSMISDAGHTGCKLKSLQYIDDESYVHDGVAFP